MLTEHCATAAAVAVSIFALQAAMLQGAAPAGGHADAGAGLGRARPASSIARALLTRALENRIVRPRRPTDRPPSFFTHTFLLAALTSSVRSKEAAKTHVYRPDFDTDMVAGAPVAPVAPRLARAPHGGHAMARLRSSISTL